MTDPTPRPVRQSPVTVTACAEPVAVERPPHAPRLIRLTRLPAVAGLGVVTVLQGIGRDVDTAATGAFLLCLGAVLILQEAQFAAAVRPWGRTGCRVLVLAAQALVTLLPVLWMGGGWQGMAGFLVGSLLLATSGPYRWPLVLLAFSLVAGLAAAAGGTPQQASFAAVQTALVGTVVYGVGRLSALVEEAHDAGDERARCAVALERHRFGRDLHDLLGYSLSAIVLKAELADHLLAVDPRRASSEVNGIVGIAREALADVRRLPDGGRCLRLAAELDGATALCAGAGIEMISRVERIELAPEVEEALAITLREGLTNVLRHSAARSVEVTLVRTGGLGRLTIVNDGVPGGYGQPVAHRSGRGLCSLAARLRRLGGRLEAGPAGPGRYVLTAAAPLVGAAARASPG